MPSVLHKTTHMRILSVLEFYDTTVESEQSMILFLVTPKNHTVYVMARCRLQVTVELQTLTNT